MRNTGWIPVVSAAVTFAVAGIVLAEGEQDRGKPAPAKPAVQSVCPADGRKITRDLYVDHEGKRIFVCGKDCVEAVKKDAAKYVMKLNAEGVALARVQATCPVMGGAIDKNQYLDYGGKRIYICCGGCMSALKADPEKYIRKLEDAGVALDPAGGSAVEPAKDNADAERK